MTRSASRKYVAIALTEPVTATAITFGKEELQTALQDASVIEKSYPLSTSSIEPQRVADDSQVDAIPTDNRQAEGTGSHTGRDN